MDSSFINASAEFVANLPVFRRILLIVGSDFRLQLVTRHWRITDAHGCQLGLFDLEARS